MRIKLSLLLSHNAHRLPLRMALLLCCFYVLACDLTPSLHATFQLQDPYGLAPDTQRFAFHLGAFSETCATSAHCQIQTLGTCNLQDNSNAKSCTATLTATTKGEQDVWIDALAADNTVLARAYSLAKFLYKGTTITAILTQACEESSECLDTDDCNGAEICYQHSCKPGTKPSVGSMCVRTDAKAGYCSDLGTCIEARCGDGYLCSANTCTTGPGGAVESCDDGNTNNEDGCDTTCAIEEGWDC